MKNNRFIFAALALFALSCQKESVSSSCVDQFLESNQLTQYTGQDLGCESFWYRYEYKGKEYYTLGNHCVDLISIPIDCDGNFLCSGGCPELEDFFLKGVNRGIVGF